VGLSAYRNVHGGEAFANESNGYQGQYRRLSDFDVEIESFWTGWRRERGLLPTNLELKKAEG
jgi:hypothetical protein